MASDASTPLILGIWISISTMSKSSPRKASTAFTPSSTITRSTSRGSSRAFRNRALVELSSAARIRSRRSSPRVSGLVRACASGAAAQGSGRSQPNSEPFPGSLITHSFPPISRTSSRQTGRPRPAPPKLRVLELSAWAKRSKMRSCWSAAMPGPVSRTSIRTVSPSRWTRTITSPRLVNFTALAVRLASTWRTRIASPRQ